MSYEPTNWKSGDVVTSAKLNKLENGVAAAGGGGVLVVNVTEDGNNLVCDKTAAEMLTAVTNGFVKFVMDNGAFFATCVSGGGIDGEGYGFSAFNAYGNLVVFEALNGTDYPSWTNSD